MNKNIGSRIYRLRTSKNLTQDQLANQVGVSRQAISKWERGDGLPDLYNVSALASALDVTVDELLGEKAQQVNNEPTLEENVNDLLMSSRGFFSGILYKAKHITNQEQAKRLRKTLLIVGILGIIIGFSMVIGGIIGFGTGAQNAVDNFGWDSEPFNPMPYMITSMLGMLVVGISVFVTYAGLAITVAGVSTEFLDNRPKCPKCGDSIDKDELMCSNCGYDLSKGINSCKHCGYDNQPGDKFCRKCGKEL